MAVTVTENAARAVRDIIKEQELDPETIHLRVGVKGGGCSGFSYLLDLTEQQRDTDEVWEYSFNLQPAAASAKAEAWRSPFGTGPDASLVTAARPVVREGGPDVTTWIPATSNRCWNGSFGLIETMPRPPLVST